MIKKLSIIMALSIFLLLPQMVFAADVNFGSNQAIAQNDEEALTVPEDDGGGGGAGSGPGTGGTTPSQIQDEKDAACVAIGGCSNSNSGFNQTVQNIVNILTIVAGGIAVIMVVVGGVRYVVSVGDQNAVQGAKNTILYAVIGLIIVVLAYTIVSFVLGNI